MNIFDAIILGVVEGLTEFLPVSSTGHMILTGYLLGISNDVFTKSFEVIIQLGAILAVVFLYKEKVFKNIRLMSKVIVSFIPTAIIGLSLYSLVKTYLLTSPLVVVGALFIGGIVILLVDSPETADTSEKDSELSENSISYRQAFYIGLFQSIAIIPGVSRSAATIIGGELLGLKRKIIVEYSFLLAIPVMFSAAALDIFKYQDIFTKDNIQVLFVGFVTAFIVAYVAIKSFLSYIQRHSFRVFGVYRIVLACIFLVILYVL